MVKPLLVLVLPAVLSLAPAPQQSTPAPPAGAPAMANPVKPTAESQAKAKKMYGYDCAMCHGATGDGKGDIPMKSIKDLTDPASLKDISDSDLYTLIKSGKGDMPGEGDRLKENDLWNMVIYVKSLAKK
ncbi:c-type cytochrome [Terriglobus tenax]|uniref:c-type cytochrome n=1 Tax=Terriglobus tenax TaxID=1111115 RepID=UPI0021E087F5|nr:c-type cytochrome [Terriglobus tenax]